MKTFTYAITDAAGIHARPAGLLVKEAKKFESKINKIWRARFRWPKAPGRLI